MRVMMNAHTDQDGPASELEALRAEIESLKEQLLRQRADLENYRRRLERTTEELVRAGRREILLAVVSAVDDLERAIAAADGRTTDPSLLEGVRLTLTRIQDSLRGFGLREIDVEGAFDPAWHEAVQTVPRADRPAGTIDAELRRGYRWGDEVLRAAGVRVTVDPSHETS